MDSAGGQQYSVMFRNNSFNGGDACLFQRNANGDPNVMPLAWFAKYTHPTTQTSFRWAIDYCFAWAETGQLVPGVIFEAGQIWPADLTSRNQVTFARQGGAYTFLNQTSRSPAGSLYIIEDSTIPARQAAVGIGMAGSATFAVQANPNMTTAFTPRPEYWIAFGSYSQGQVLDPGNIPNAVQISFPPNIYTMLVTLNADNTFTVQPLSMLEAESMETASAEDAARQE